MEQCVGRRTIPQNHFARFKVATGEGAAIPSSFDGTGFYGVWDLTAVVKVRITIVTAVFVKHSSLNNPYDDR